MARNRKSQSAAVRLGPAIKAFLLCLLVAGSGVGYVWQKKQLIELGHRIKEHEIELKRLRTENREYQNQFDTLRSPMVLEARIRELNLGLGAPHPSQIQRLELPPDVIEGGEQRFSAAPGAKNLTVR